jgi:hypothetical protein
MVQGTLPYVRDNILSLTDFATSRKRALAEEAHQRKRLEAARVAQLRLNYEAFRSAETTRYIEHVLGPQEREVMLERHRRQNRRLFPGMPSDELEALTQGTVRSEVQHDGHLAILAFEDFMKCQSSLSAVEAEPTS